MALRLGARSLVTQDQCDLRAHCIADRRATVRTPDRGADR
jgi:hypothetical protein